MPYQSMKAVLLKSFGGPEELFIGDYQTPIPSEHEILVKVHCTALNRADTLQRQGRYPQPEGESPILGLEMSGEIVKIGQSVKRWKVGDRVCGLLGGGGYAEFAKIHESLAIPIPKGYSMQEAAAIPEVFLTAYQSLSWLAEIQKNESILIHAGASGVGTAAIQLAKIMGVQPIIVTASSTKHGDCFSLGANQVINYRVADFQEVILKDFNLEGVDVVVDFVGATYFQRNLNVLKTDGRLVMLSALGGVKMRDVNLLPILKKRLKIMGTTLRSRTEDYKIQLTQDFVHFAFSAFENRTIHPVIDSIYDWEQVSEAHQYMEDNRNIGKIILNVMV